MIYYRKNVKLLEKVITVFGDIIEDVYLSSTHYIDIEHPTLNKALMRFISEHVESRPEDMTTMDFSPEFIVKFKNGNQVKFTCSEWGDASKVRVDNNAKFMEI